MKKHNKIIYLLDDDSEFCEIISDILSPFGTIFSFTESIPLLKKLSEALKKQKLVPDLIIVDLNLNDINMNGFDVIKKIKKAPNSHLIPILMVSGADSLEILQKAFKSGIEDYISKPIIPQLFLSKIEHILYQFNSKLHLNALTGLPGNHIIEAEYNIRQKQKQAFSVAYVDMDNFKPFNDTKGVKAGDKAIQILSDILKFIREKYSRDQLFIGHLGGDDFFLLGYKSYILKSIKLINKQFTKKIQDLFSEEEQNNKFYISKNRKGKIAKFPLLSISTAIIHIPKNYKLSFLQLTKEEAKLKKIAKLKKGNSIVEKTL